MDADQVRRPMEGAVLPVGEALPPLFTGVLAAVWRDPRRSTQDPAVWDQMVLDALRGASTLPQEVVK